MIENQDKKEQALLEEQVFNRGGKLGKELTTGQNALCCGRCKLNQFDWLKDYEIIGVEEEVVTEINGYKFTGFIDLLVKHKERNEYTIIDHKSSAYPLKKDGKTVLKKSEEDFIKYKRQMYLYCKYVFEKYGEYPKWIMWNHFKEQKFVKIPFLKSEYKETIKWFSDTIKSIEKDNKYDANVE